MKAIKRSRRPQPALYLGSGPLKVRVTRVPSSVGLEPKLRVWVEREARRYGVSWSFVLANCVSFASGIDVTYDYKADREADRE